MAKAVERGLDWAGLPVIATVARLLCRGLTLQNEYLRLENRILKEKVSRRIRFTDEERRSLAEAALAMGRSLMKEVVGIVKPETILAWQRRLEQWKWDYSERRRRGPGRPRTPDDIAADANAHAERWVRSVTEECLDHLVLFGLASLQRALRIYQDFFNGHRPHQGISNRIPERQADGAVPLDQVHGICDRKLTVECKQFLGGPLNSYYRKAA